MITYNLLYKFVNGIELLVVSIALQTAIIKDAHLRGDFTSDKTLAILKGNYYINQVEEKLTSVFQVALNVFKLTEKTINKSSTGYLDARDSVSSDIIEKSFKQCGISCALDGSLNRTFHPAVYVTQLKWPGKKFLDLIFDSDIDDGFERSFFDK